MERAEPNILNRNNQLPLAVIIPAMDEADKIGDVLSQVNRLNPDYVVVVVNGSTDETAKIARAYKAMVIEYEKPLGNDVGRAIGAMQVEAMTYLFLDADIVIPAEDLLPFITDIEEGTDLALNAIDWVARHPRPHEPAVDRYFINLIQGRRDLGLESVLTIPHAFSKKSLDIIGKETLANPQLANAVAINKGLTIKISNDINVLKMNKKRTNHIRKKGEMMSQAYQRMHGDTVEACYYLLEELGVRGGFSGGDRKREQYYKYKDSRFESKVSTTNTSIILSVSDNSIYFSQLLESLVKLDYEIVPVVHGESEKLRNQLRKHKLKFIDIPEYLGHDTAFAIGSKVASGENLIFHDAAIPIDPFELKPYIHKLRRGQADIVINNQQRNEDVEEDYDYVGKLVSMHPVHIGSYFMNITMGRNELTISSMMLPPYGMKRSVLEAIGSVCLLNPCLAQIRAQQRNYHIVPAGSIDLIERINEEVLRDLLNHERILGDMMEALHYWTFLYGPRAAFYDGNRLRNILNNSKGFYKINPFRTKMSQLDAESYWLEEYMENQLASDPGNDAIKQCLGQLFIEQLELYKELYSPDEYVQLLKEYLHEHLPLHEYYVIGKMLLEHYKTTDQHDQYLRLIDHLFGKFRNYPVLMEELQFLKDK